MGVRNLSPHNSPRGDFTMEYRASRVCGRPADRDEGGLIPSSAPPAPSHHGTVTVHVAPVTEVTPSGENADSTVQVKSPADGAVAPAQSSKLILKSCPGRGVMAVAFTTTVLSA